MFQKARIRLTAWYLLIIMAVSLMFSSIIYQAATMELTRFELRHRKRMEQRIQNFPRNMLPSDSGYPAPPLPSLPSTPDLIDEAKLRIIWLLFILNSGVFVVAGFLGYILAGRTLNPIQEMMDEQNRFISDASHELKTPLTSLKTAMEVHLREKKPSLAETKLLLAESILEVDKLHGLSDSLLQLAQYEQPSMNLSFENITIKQIVEKAIQKIQPVAKVKQISIGKDIDDSEIYGNESSLVDVLVILLDNAVKYSPDNSTISVEAKKKNKFVYVSVEDEGVGIAEKDQLHIFDRFYRADTVRAKKESGGYGLGLSIAKKIVESHHGKIRVTSLLDKGTTISIKLPRYI